MREGSQRQWHVHQECLQGGLPEFTSSTCCHGCAARADAAPLRQAPAGCCVPLRASCGRMPALPACPHAQPRWLHPSHAAAPQQPRLHTDTVAPAGRARAMRTGHAPP